MYGNTYSKSMDQSGKVANPARGQLNRGNEYFPVRVRSRLRIWSRETGSTVPSRVSLLIPILRLNLVLTYGIPPRSTTTKGLDTKMKTKIITVRGNTLALMF